MLPLALDTGYIELLFCNELTDQRRFVYRSNNNDILLRGRQLVQQFRFFTCHHQDIFLQQGGCFLYDQWYPGL